MGLPRNPLQDLRDEYKERFNLTDKQARYLNQKFLDQLENCKSDDARRILLGVGRKEKK
jgi:DNA-binding transcriptional regulator/RsmH inhibitor MraZ